MSKIMPNVAVTLSILLSCLMIGSTSAQTTCELAYSLPINTTDMLGTWYEVSATKNAYNINVSCVELNVTLQNDNTTVRVDATYANSTSSYLMNQVIMSEASLTTGNYSYGYNFTSSMSTANNSTTLKIVYAMDGFALACGYNNNGSFGMVLSKVMLPNSINLVSVMQQAATNYTDFAAVNLTTVVQSTQCATVMNNGAMRSLPIMSAVLALMYMLLNFICN